MPRFFFDLISTSGTTLVGDENGAEFADLDMAIQDAERGFADLVAEAMLEKKPINFAAIDVRDQNGRVLETLRFDEVGQRVRHISR